MNTLRIRDIAPRTFLFLLSTLVLGSTLLSAQESRSPYHVLLEHVIQEHLPDARVGIVLDGFPRIDIAVAMAESRTDVAAPYHEMVRCTDGARRNCRIIADVTHLVRIQDIDRKPGTVRVLVFISQEVGEAPTTHLRGSQRIVTLTREESGWVVTSDVAGIQT